jgi:hypothetical protein
MRRPVDYPGKLPRFPICSAGREDCALLGFHHHNHATDEERARVRAWFAWFDAQHRRRSA